MPISEHDLVSRFGAAVDRHVAALFVGAGLSQGAGLPNWLDLMRPLAAQVDMTDLRDLPLVAEYYEQDPVRGGRARLEQHLLDALSPVSVPTEGHRLCFELGVSEIWTTNFDPLLELAGKPCTVVADDRSADAIETQSNVIVKMHGGFGSHNGTLKWQSDPIITRGDFERYEYTHPRLWARLRATYLTRTFLFLGFSFTDPNIELLLRLARQQQTADENRHLAVLISPTDHANRGAHDLRVRDLERSGVLVCEISDASALLPLLFSLRARTRPPAVFVSGSGDASLPQWCDVVGSVIAEQPGWGVASLGGDAGWYTTRRVGIQRQSTGTYDPETLRLYFRRKGGAAPPPLSERIGTAVFSDLDRDPLVTNVILQCRALVAIGGGDRTREEVDIALRAGLSVVPVAASGGAARDAWQTATEVGSDPRRLRVGGREADRRVWQGLQDADNFLVTQALRTLAKQAMYEEE